MAAISILIVEDHPLFLEALQSSLELGLPGLKAEVAASVSEASSKLSHSSYDLVLLDLRLPDSSGFDGFLKIKSLCGNSPLAVISATENAEIVRHARQLGAAGFINKSLPRQTIVSAVMDLAQGGEHFVADSASSLGKASSEDVFERIRNLTPAQLKVLIKLREGKLNKQIAFELGVAETTIKAHITFILKKLGVHSRTQAVLFLQRLSGERDEDLLNLLKSLEN